MALPVLLVLLLAPVAAVAQQGPIPLVQPPAPQEAPMPPPSAPQAEPLPPPSALPMPPPTAAPSEGAVPLAQAGRVFCAQDVTFRLADPAGVPESFRGFLGIWSDADWDLRTCAALIVENVQPDGTAAITYVFGPNGSNSRVPGGVLHGTGVIRDGALLFQNSDGTQFVFRPLLVDLAGRMTTPKGATFETVFKKTP